MSSLNERAAGHSVTTRRHGGEPCRRRRGAGLCVAVGISMVTLTAGAPTRVPAGQPSEVSRAQNTAAPVLFVLPKLEVEPAEPTKLFWFIVKGGEDVPPGAHVLIRGVPPGVSLSSGQANPEGLWVVPLSELEELEITVPRSFSGKLVLDAALVDGRGAVLDEHPVELVVERVAVAAANDAAADSPKPAAVAGPGRTGADAAPRQQAIDTTAPPSRRPPAPALVVAPALDAEAAAATRLNVGVGGRPDDLPPGTYVRVKGLAGGVTLSAGQANADRGWVLPLWALDDLKIRVPPDVSGTLRLDIALVSDGAALAERSVALHVKPRVAAAPSDLGSPRKTTVAAPAPARTTPRAVRANGNDRPPRSARRRSALALRQAKQAGATSDMPNAKSGFCLLEWHYFDPKVLWHIGECGDAAGR